jgi:hypothetical protein
VLIALSVLTFNAHALLYNTEEWVTLVGPLASDAAIQQELSTYLADQLIEATGLSQRAGIAGAVASASEPLIQRTLAGAFASQTFRDGWVALNQAAHQELVGALRGDPQSLLSVHDNTLWLDLTPLLARGVDSLRQQVPGLSLVLAAMPGRDPLSALRSSRDDLSVAIGHALPAGFGEVALVHSAQLATLQWVAQTIQALVVVLPIAAVAAVIATLWLARHRARVVALLGIEVVIVFVVMWLLVNTIIGRYAASTGDAATVAVAHAVAGVLLRLDLVAIAIGVLVAVVGLALSVFGSRSGEPQRPAPQAGRAR